MGSVLDGSLSGSIRILSFVSPTDFHYFTMDNRSWSLLEGLGVVIPEVLGSIRWGGFSIRFPKYKNSSMGRFGPARVSGPVEGTRENRRSIVRLSSSIPIPEKRGRESPPSFFLLSLLLSPLQNRSVAP
jgi:hypothetical protein